MYATLDVNDDCKGLLPAGCHGNLPVLNLLSASVTKNQHFRQCRKNYAKSAYDFFRFVYCFIVLLRVSLVPQPTHDIFLTPVA